METDFAETLAVVPQVEAASPGYIMIPSYSAGVGFPIRLLPEPSVAIRLLAEMSIFFTGIGVFVDMQPWSSDEIELGVYGIISF